MKTRDEIQNEALKTILPLKRAGVGVSMGVFVKLNKKLYLYIVKHITHEHSKIIWS